MERKAGIEPASSAWKAVTLPLSYIRVAWVGGIEPPSVVLETTTLPLSYTRTEV